jgi:GTPase SAR1 family protein
LHDPENQEVSVPSAASVVRKPSIIDRLKSFFGVKKEVNEIKISVTQEKFFKKSWKVGKKKLHQRKIVPVIIWDFGGQDVFYSTHQTFLTYRAIYMLVLDGSRTLDEPCPFEQYLPGKGGTKTQRGSRFFLCIRCLITPT